MTAARHFFSFSLSAPDISAQRRVLIAVGAACALHALLLMGLLKNAPPTPSHRLAAPSKERLQWRWLPATATPVNGTRSVETHKDAIGPRAAIPPAARPTVGRPAGRTYSPHEQQTEPSDLPSQASARPPLPSAPLTADAPLQLQLPTSPPAWESTHSIRSQALNDTRSNTGRNTLEDRIGQVTTGNDGLHVDTLGEGRKRVRMNGRCVDVHQARIAQIDAMNEVSSRTMAGVKPC
ncbi:MAG: hypothetical protein ACKOF9_02765 [Burkholderiales bacterium]